MSDLPKTITIQLKVRVDPDEILLHHEHLKGFLSFKFSSQDLAIIQLEALRTDKSKSQVEDFIDDTTTLIALSGQLKDAINDLRKKD